MSKKIVNDQAEEKGKPNPPGIYITDKTTEASGDLPLLQHNIGEVEKKAFKLKKINFQIGVFEKPFSDIHGNKKYYQIVGNWIGRKLIPRVQIESIDPVTNLPIMIYEDGTECGYFVNLLPEDITLHNNQGLELKP